MRVGSAPALWGGTGCTIGGSLACSLKTLVHLLDAVRHADIAPNGSETLDGEVGRDHRDVV
jgi:hypothetical protein